MDTAQVSTPLLHAEFVRLRVRDRAGWCDPGEGAGLLHPRQKEGAHRPVLPDF